MADVVQRQSPLTSRDERGSVLIFVALVMVVILGMAALAVDLGNARQKRGNAQVASDGGALAGAYAMRGQTPSGCFADVDCTAAYYTFQSLGIPVGSTPLTPSGGCGAHCSHYELESATVDVTSPYPFPGGVPKDYVHVRACDNNKNAFAPVLGFAFTRVCAAATAQNVNGVVGTPTSPKPSLDCQGQDNFADANDQPTIFPGAQDDPPKSGTTIGALFHSRDSSLNLGSIDFEAPNAQGQKVTLSYDASGTGQSGYSLDPPPPPTGIYPDQTDVRIFYKLPGNLKKDDHGARIVYTAKLYVEQILQDNPPECGKAAWTFTSDGQGSTTPPGCGEDSFIASVYPPNGTAMPGAHIGAIYSDESPLQAEPWSEAFPFGIKFTLSGPGWDDANGNPTFVPYTLSPATAKDKFSTRIDFQLPDASKFAAGVLYTASLTAYDTDQNKPGNDCGHATWTFTITGASAPLIRLVE